MKIHGNIEAYAAIKKPPLQSWYPWMKIHGNIEARQWSRNGDKMDGYPWMKIHGNIEAKMAHTYPQRSYHVSMDENPWQH